MGKEQKVVIITGASQGIGAELVKGYRDRNYRVVANSRSIKPSSDPDILAVAGDIADPATAQKIVSQAVERFGRVDSLVNNAGIFIAKPFTDYSAEDFASIIAVNLGSFFRVSQLAAAEMLKQGSGHIVQITTSLVDHANSNVPSVLASLTKGGLNAATRSLAIEYAKKGIRVNAVAPGVIETEMSQGVRELAGDEVKARILLKRFGKPEDVACAVWFLASAYASYITGEVLHVDGGFKME